MANDVEIIAGILGILLVMGIIMPWVAEATGVTSSNPDFIVPRELYGNQTAIDEYGDISSGTWYPMTGLGIISSLATAFFWKYSWFPAWLTALHVLIRIIGAILIYRQIRSGAG